MISLKSQKREVLGKNSKSLILEGFLPAELYGHEIENEHIKVDISDFNSVLSEAGESSLVELKTDKGKYPVLIHDIQRSPLGEIQHVDFYAVKMGEKMTAEVVFKFINEAPAVKEQGGVMITSIDSVEVEALPSLLPHEIEVDLSTLKEIGDVIHIEDIVFPDDVKSLLDGDSVVVSVSEPTTQEEEGEEVEEDEADSDKKPEDDSSSEQNDEKGEEVNNEKNNG